MTKRYGNHYRQERQACRKKSEVLLFSVSYVAANARHFAENSAERESIELRGGVRKESEMDQRWINGARHDY